MKTFWKRFAECANNVFKKCFYLRNFVGAQKRFKNVFRKRFLKTLYNICWKCFLKTFFITFKFRQTNMFSKYWKYLFLLIKYIQKITFRFLTRCHFIIQLFSIVSDRDWQNSSCFDNLFMFCGFVQQFYPWCVYHIHNITTLYHCSQLISNSYPLQNMYCIDTQLCTKCPSSRALLSEDCLKSNQSNRSWS